MTKEVTTRWIREGRTRLRVPTRGETPPRPTRRPSGPVKGPGRVEGGVFYNPAMRFSRDLSVLFTQVQLERRAAEAKEKGTPRPYRILDALAATGARIVRLAHETRIPPSIRFQGVACDRDPRVVALLRGNVAANHASDRVAAIRDDLHRVVVSGWWDHVDVDPFGSPAPFLDSAVRRLSRGATLALTATDTAALTGSAPAACRRRYDAEPWHGAGMHETALRILAGAAVRSGARHEVALRPVLAHATDHYVRVYLQAEKGARRADDAIAGLGFAVQDGDGTRRLVNSLKEVPADAARLAGPLWAGPLQDGSWVDALTSRLGSHPQLEARPLEKFLHLAAEESDAPPLVYEMGELARAIGSGPPGMQELIAALVETGHKASRCHTSPTGIKTDASWPIMTSLACGRKG